MTVKPIRDIETWLSFADCRYMGARFLFRKGLTVEFILSAAQAYELYFKTFLYRHEGTFQASHNLTKLCEMCSKHEAIFSEILLDPNWEMGTISEWVDFWKYPEPKAGKTRPRHSVWGTDDLYRLDLVAHVVHRAIEPCEGETEIQRLLKGMPTRALGMNTETLEEFEECFRRGNNFFSSSGAPVDALPENAWRPSKPRE